MLLAIGGAQEALLAWPGTYDIIPNKRHAPPGRLAPPLVCIHGWCLWYCIQASQQIHMTIGTARWALLCPFLLQIGREALK